VIYDPLADCLAPETSPATFATLLQLPSNKRFSPYIWKYK